MSFLRTSAKLFYLLQNFVMPLCFDMYAHHRFYLLFVTVAASPRSLTNTSTKRYPWSRRDITTFVMNSEIQEHTCFAHHITNGNQRLILLQCTLMVPKHASQLHPHNRFLEKSTNTIINASDERAETLIATRCYSAHPCEHFNACISTHLLRHSS